MSDDRATVEVVYLDAESEQRFHHQDFDTPKDALQWINTQFAMQRFIIRRGDRTYYVPLSRILSVIERY